MRTVVKVYLQNMLYEFFEDMRARNLHNIKAYGHFRNCIYIIKRFNCIEIIERLNSWFADGFPLKFKCISMTLNLTR